MSKEGNYLHLKKGSFLVIIGLSVLLGALPVISKGIQLEHSAKVEAATIDVPMYPGLSWSKPAASQVAVLLGPDGGKQTIDVADGQVLSGESSINQSDKVFFYYDKALTDLGFSKISTVGEPADKKSWVSDFLKDNSQYVQVQYFPDPGKSGKFVTKFFYGAYPEPN